MQKFLVGPSVGGASITFGAVRYLIRTVGEGLDPLWQYMNEHPSDNAISESNGSVGYVDKDLFSPLMSAWWKHFKSHRHIPDGREFDFDTNISDDSELAFLWGEHAEMRKMLIPFIERLEGEFAEFDRLNGKTPLRVVEVPDGYYCIVADDYETGCEYVEEISRTWGAMHDDEYRAVAAVRKFVAHDASKHDWYEEDKVYSLGGSILLVLSGKYGAARCTIGDGNTRYLFLRKNEYYCATEEHPEKTTFEINNIPSSKFALDEPFVDGDRALAYAKLVGLLESCAGKE